jgi:hypothetical protein
MLIRLQTTAAEEWHGIEMLQLCPVWIQNKSAESSIWAVSYVWFNFKGLSEINLKNVFTHIHKSAVLLIQIWSHHFQTVFLW